MVVGRRLGRRPLGQKTWEGFGAFVAVGFVIGMLFFPWPVALVGAVVGGIVELYTPEWANDNSVVPIVSGLALSLLS